MHHITQSKENALVLKRKMMNSSSFSAQRPHRTAGTFSGSFRFFIKSRFTFSSEVRRVRTEAEAPSTKKLSFLGQRPVSGFNTALSSLNGILSYKRSRLKVSIRGIRL